MKKLLITIPFLFISLNVLAFLPAPPLGELKAKLVPPLHLHSKDYNFEAIVKLSNCSGAIIKFEGQKQSDNAIVLTNGHCLGKPFLKPGQVIYKKRTYRRMRVADSNMKFHRITAKEIIYATMTDTDSALYRLKESYHDLEKLGIQPFTLSKHRPGIGESIEIISGYWERGYSCRIDEFIHILKEAAWVFTDSIRYTSTGCKTIGGTSGSPIIRSGSKTVIGVNNTGNESGKRCSINNPCEVDENNYVTVRKGASYGQQTYLFYSCLNSQNKLDLNLSSCKLPK